MTRRAIVASLLAVVLIVVTVITSFIVVGTIGSQCHNAQNEWDALHRVIEKAYAPIDRRKLPKQFRNLVNPALQKRQKVEVEQVQGARPSC